MSEEPPRKGLGRGLSALLAEDPDDQPALDRLRVGKTVPIESLVPNRYQPRSYFDPEELVRGWATESAKGKEMDYAESFRITTLVDEETWKKVKEPAYWQDLLG